MKFRNAKGNLAVIFLMTLFCLSVFSYGVYASYYGLLLFQQGAFNFIIGLFFLVCIGIPSIYWVLTTMYRYFAAVPSYVNQRKIRVINPLLVHEKGLYSETEKWLCTRVKELAQAEGLPKTPVVGIELCDDNPNAYAVGATRSYAMVVATTGLIKQLSHREVAAVMAHELGHIANLDTMAKTLLSAALDGVMLILFTPMLLIVWYFGRFVALLMLAAGVIYGLMGNWQHATGFFVGVLVWILLMMLPMITKFLVTLLTFWHSRWREYHADAVAARLTSVDDMVSALVRLDRLPFEPPKKNKEQMATLWIRVAMTQETGVFHWLKHTHPPIHKRIEALRRGFYLR
ncbi:M48 family metallopeptidase [Aetokthonos hydrillicola Thurmond2011]|jgi:heat shock protein HtpX|uniref:M48 family metallopeptidase n=1 Tax=Aetokthonos hydrillicola Thurmond2011 TaxID=2712845 RepID=A0AAP5ICF9_9CYAN|nr:M48 family metallopeptidase [Aetokthonos hydrillicola]MBO3460368.1 M48 family metalloprotease [Aetokthonos hydrillicola CCALA 1050]MBW4588365.1 M48 family metalloprotease [Aetokthonos hydrillicola CCALA 1050]MDR9896475.1 M48 family metallopeptidase [Aetokthonos hydrillicola Thurmond2011]